jgi:hypothetical protein
MYSEEDKPSEENLISKDSAQWDLAISYSRPQGNELLGTLILGQMENNHLFLTDMGFGGELKQGRAKKVRRNP